MSDLIERQAAIDALGEEPEVWSGNDEYEQGLNNQWHYDVNALKDLPSAQPERKVGKWINGACSQCGSHAPYWAMASTYYGSDFCPNCGADMRGERR